MGIETPDIPAYRLACMQARAKLAKPGDPGPWSLLVAAGIHPDRIAAIADGMEPTPAERAALEKEAKP